MHLHKVQNKDHGMHHTYNIRHNYSNYTERTIWQTWHVIDMPTLLEHNNHKSKTGCNTTAEPDPSTVVHIDRSPFKNTHDQLPAEGPPSLLARDIHDPLHTKNKK